MNIPAQYNDNTHQAARPSANVLPGVATSTPGHKLPLSNDQLVIDVEYLVSGFRHLLAEHPESPKESNIHFEITVLEKWLDGYHHGRAAALKIATYGAAWLEKHQEKFKLIADEAARLTAAGVWPLTLAQVTLMQNQRDSILPATTTAPSVTEEMVDMKLDPVKLEPN
jgi:hypothetical protein